MHFAREDERRKVAPRPAFVAARHSRAVLSASCGSTICSGSSKRFQDDGRGTSVALPAALVSQPGGPATLAPANVTTSVLLRLAKAGRSGRAVRTACRLPPRGCPGRRLVRLFFHGSLRLSPPLLSLTEPDGAVKGAWPCGSVVRLRLGARDGGGPCLLDPLWIHAAVDQTIRGPTSRPTHVVGLQILHTTSRHRRVETGPAALYSVSTHRPCERLQQR